MRVMSHKKKQEFPNQIQANQSIVNVGSGRMENVTLKYSGQSKQEIRTKEELIQEILSHSYRYMEQIEQLEQLDASTKEEAIDALIQVRRELQKETPDEGRIKDTWE